MKKILGFCAALAMVCLLSPNQASAQFGVEAGIALPTGDFSDFAGTGFGGAVTYKKKFGPIKAGGSVGYTTFSEKDGIGGLDVIPVKGIVEYLIPGVGFRPFVGGHIGYYLIQEDNADNQLGFGIGAGAYLTQKLNARVDYNSIQTEGTAATFLGVTVGIAF